MVRQKIFFTLMCLLMFAPLGLLVAENAFGWEFPSWLSAEGATYLEGDEVEPHVEEHLSLEGFLDKSLQVSLEEEMGNHVPLKGTAMLTTAAWQRSAIATSNLLYQFDAYPTYYASTRVYLPQTNSFAVIPSEYTEKTEHGLHKFMNRVLKAARLNRDRNFVVFLVPGLEEPQVNPVNSLVTSPLTPERALEVFQAALDENPRKNVHILTLSYDSLEPYYREYFSTDHHWNTRGTLRAYEKLAEILDWDDAEAGAEYPIEGSPFSGSKSRTGLYTLGDEIFDVERDFSNLVTLNSSDKKVGKTDSKDEYYNAKPEKQQFSFYGLWYDSMIEPNGAITGGKGSENALVVANSYGATISPWIAQNYDLVRTSEAMYGEVQESPTLNEFIEKDDPADIIFFAHAGAYASFCKRLPDFFE